MIETRYKDSIDSSSESIPECAKWALIGDCPNPNCPDHQQGKSKAKLILCGKEWCSVCGANRSWIHNRRIARLLWRAQQMEKMGYFVIEWPIKSRYKLRTKQALSDIGKRIKGAMQALGYERGLRRWHFFGDSGIRYNPHLNVLVDDGYLSKQRLDEIKSYLRTVLDEPQLIVNYSFRISTAEKMHTLRYVTRATFLDQSWDCALAASLYGFQNTQYWGSKEVWSDDPVWILDEKGNDDMDLTKIEKLERGLCPCCNEPLIWSKPVPLVLIEAFGGKHIGAGFYELPPPGDPPDRLTDEDMRGCQEWLDSVNQVAQNIVEKRNEEKRDLQSFTGCQMSLHLNSIA